MRILVTDVEIQIKTIFSCIGMSFCSIIDLWTYDFKFLEIANFVELFELYRLTYKGNLDKIAFIENPACNSNPYMTFEIENHSIDNERSAFHLEKN